MFKKAVLAIHYVGFNSAQSLLDVLPGFGTGCRGDLRWQDALGFRVVGHLFGECARLVPTHAKTCECSGVWRRSSCSITPERLQRNLPKCTYFLAVVSVRNSCRNRLIVVDEPVSWKFQAAADPVWSRQKVNG